MAQLAAQDYFTRLQASGMSHLVHPDMAGFSGLSSLPNSSPLSGNQKVSNTTSGNISNKASTKKRDKTSNNDSMNYNNYQQKNHSSNVNISRDNDKNSSSSSSSYKVQLSSF